MRLFIFLYPWLELLSLIQLGIETSALVPLAWVVAMIMLGSSMLRRVGMASVMRLREAQQSGILQQHLLLDDMAVAVAALLLIVPGLLSDFFALIILIGPLRRRLARLLGGEPRPADAFNDFSPNASAEDVDASSRSTAHLNVTLEGEFQRVDDEPTKRK